MRDYSRRLKLYCDVFGIRGVPYAIQAKLSSAPKRVQVTVPGIRHPVTVRLGTTDIDSYRQIVANRAYEFRMPEPPGVVLDAGANIGLASIYFANSFPGAKIIAVEPAEANFALLRENVSPYDRIVPVRAALWSENALVDLVDPGLGAWGFQIRSGGTDRGGPLGTVQGVTVDRIMRDHGIEFIDILKVDIEGAEKEVFGDASKWIDKVGVLVIELHERLKAGCSRSVYNAAKGFDVRWKQRENVFFARSAR